MTIERPKNMNEIKGPTTKQRPKRLFFHSPSSAHFVVSKALHGGRFLASPVAPIRGGRLRVKVDHSYRTASRKRFYGYP
jgi:hypothetical protein